jgi:cytochrome P450
MLAAASPFAATTAPERLAAYAEIARSGPVVRTVLPNGLPAWLVTGWSEVRQALSDERFVKSGTPVSMMLAKLRPQLLPAIASHMLRVDGPDHVRLRRLVSAAFTRRPMEALDGRIAELTGDLLGVSRQPGTARRTSSTSTRSSPIRCR